MDLKFIRIMNLIPVTSISILPGVTPPTLDIIGSGFSSAEAVYINTLASEHFLIISDNRILAQIPNIVDRAIEDIQVWTTELTTTKINKIVPGLGNSAGTVTGLKKLIQRFVKLLLSSPETDAWGSVGGGLISLFRTPTSPDGKELCTGAVLAFNRVKEFLLSISPTTAEETIQNLELEDTIWDFTTLTLTMKIKLTNAAGNSVSTALGFGNV